MSHCERVKVTSRTTLSAPTTVCLIAVHWQASWIGLVSWKRSDRLVSRIQNVQLMPACLAVSQHRSCCSLQCACLNDSAASWRLDGVAELARCIAHLSLSRITSPTNRRRTNYTNSAFYQWMMLTMTINYTIAL